MCCYIMDRFVVTIFLLEFCFLNQIQKGPFLNMEVQRVRKVKSYYEIQDFQVSILVS
jgi:hypothetical protein